MSEDEKLDENRVVLRGRLAAEPVEKELPSGDVLAVFRLTVARPPDDRVRVDSLECVTSGARARKVLARANPGDVVEVEGSLRRRFWRTPAGPPASRYSVDAAIVRLISRQGAGRTTGASRARKQASG